MGFLVVDRLSKTFPDASRRGETMLKAVDEVSFDCRAGEMLVVLGPSGSGKSTLLRLVAGLEIPTSGTVSLAGRCLDNIPAGKRNIAMVFQSPALYPEMSVNENLQFGPKVRGCHSKEAAERARQAAAMLGLSHCLHRLPYQLSGGERQRVALGRTLVRRPELILMDEPLSNLDPRSRTDLKNQITRVQRQLGTSTIYVTHDQTEALTIADRIMIIDRGRVLQKGTPIEVYDKPASLTVAQFVGSAPMNLLKGQLIQKGSGLFFETPDRDGTAGISLDFSYGIPRLLDSDTGKEMILGLRPEHILVGFGTSEQSSRNCGPSLPARVRKLEFTGADYLVELEAGAELFTARVPAIAALENGQPVSLCFNLTKSSFFDPSTGRNLCAS